MIKAALFDVDGLVLAPRERFFSHAFAERQGIPKEAVEKFFLGAFKQCSFGACDLKEEIAPFLPTWNWTGSVDELLEYWFASESRKDEAVLAVVDALRRAGVRCYIATRQEKYRFRYLLEEVGLKDHFDGAFCTCEIGHDKKTPEFYRHILGTLELAPSEVLFFDDTHANVEAARALGIEAYFYDGIGMLKERVAPLIASSSR